MAEFQKLSFLDKAGLGEGWKGGVWLMRLKVILPFGLLDCRVDDSWQKLTTGCMPHY